MILLLLDLVDSQGFDLVALAGPLLEGRRTFVYQVTDRKGNCVALTAAAWALAGEAIAEHERRSR